MKTKITFKKKSDTHIIVLINKKEVGQIYSETKDGNLPYPHEDDKEYCKKSIQICGFDKCSEVWACGVYHGRKDLVLNFFDYDEDYMKEQEGMYRRYVTEYLESNLPMDKLKSFYDWWSHMGHPAIWKIREFVRDKTEQAQAEEKKECT